MTLPDLDLFGNPILAPAPMVPGTGKKRHKTKINGYAAPPGTGPVDETCKTCLHYSGHRRSKIYRKCALTRPRWTGGPGTDILARSPACKYWEPQTA